MSDRPYKFGTTPFFFVRHGETHESEREITQGQFESQLSSAGFAAAERSARVLQQVGLASIFSSPLKRAWDTATIINGLARVPLHPLAGLMERHWGPYQGRPKSERPRERNPESVERLEDFTTRVLNAMSAIDGPTPLLVVSHSGVFRVLWQHAGLLPEMRASISNGEPLKFTPPTSQRPRWQVSMV